MAGDKKLIKNQYKDQIWIDPVWYQQEVGLTHARKQEATIKESSGHPQPNG
jgi:hypothetical protein